MKKLIFIRHIILSHVVILFFSATVGAASIKPDIHPGKGVTGQRNISYYSSVLKKTNLDTPVFIMDSGKPGATALIIGGTHGNELAGYISALLFVERAMIEQGKLFVIPIANRSALSIPDTQKPIPHQFSANSRSGIRVLLYGDRYTDIEDHKNDHSSVKLSRTKPVVYLDRKSRNLNRMYPGNPEGNPTQQLAHAILELIISENIDFCIDFHEARTPEKATNSDMNRHPTNGWLSYSLISHPRGIETAAFALLAVEENIQVTVKLEESKPENKGMSHWEIGSRTRCISFLSESPNPGQDRWRKKPDVIKDPNYPLNHRVGMHIWVFYYLAEAFTDATSKPFKIGGLPTYKDLMNSDIGTFLN